MSYKSSFFRNRIFPLLLVALVLPLFWVLSCEGEQRQRPVLEYDRSNPTSNGSRFPHLYSPDGESFWMSWVSRIEEGVAAVEYSRYQDGRWEPPSTMRVSNDILVNWADRPSIVHIGEETPVLHWLRRFEGGARSRDLRIAFPGEQARQWDHHLLSEDLDGAGRGFASMVPYDEEHVQVTWVDGRQLAPADVEEGADVGAGETATLRSAVIGQDGARSDEEVLDSAISPCNPTAVASTGNGSLLVYRAYGSSGKEIAQVRFDREAEQWNEPQTISSDGWQMDQCVVSPPAVAAMNDQAVVAWHSVAGDEGRIQMAWSDDSGESYHDPVTLGEGPVMGRVAVGSAEADNSFYVAWMQESGNLAAIMVQRITEEGLSGEPFLVGTTDMERESGFPALVGLEEGVMFAWTQTVPFFRVRTAFVRYPELIEGQ